ncbi:hypothetical protein [Acinetobacter sp. HR7]|uniref:hypothetical protein n=1 Tax=Acinetobacter sp. HR7 TaxID=1509403 RepID=UPI0005383B6E|nr:hypothetical protein [Acinetobacter sp. HR7]KGT46405.1 hypothetical protein GW12_25640 [Acinetobacter sp. HR7]
MSNINIYLREELPKLSEKDIYIAPNIPEKKLNKAIKSFKYDGNPENIIALLDTTLLGSGADGLMFTGEKVIFKPGYLDPHHIKYEDITDVRVEFVKSKAESVTIVTKNEKIKLQYISSYCNLVELEKVLKYVSQEFEEYTEQRQVVPLEEMDEKLKLAYLKIIINMTYENDQIIDKKEMAEIFLLMNRLGLKQETRFEIRSYMFAPDELQETSILFDELNKNIIDGQSNTVHISLAKDLINIHFATQSRDLEKFEFLQKNRNLLNIKDSDLNIIVLALETDYKLLEEDFTDDKMTAAFKELSAKAAAVGTPLAAIYLSGSVIGMSAAGMTSGLAMLGMGGILGLSSMATGIGVAILIGVGAYAGIKKITGTDEVSNYKRKELMLNEVIKQTQDTISTIVNDINYVTSKLNTTISQITKLTDNQNALKNLNRELLQQIAMLKGISGAAEILNIKVHDTKGESNKLKCPKVLDLSKLEALTSEPTKKQFHDFILSFYIEKETRDVNNSDTQVITKWVINPSRKAEFAQLADAFEVIGYFNISDVIASKTKQALSGLFS